MTASVGNRQHTMRIDDYTRSGPPNVCPTQSSLLEATQRDGVALQLRIDQAGKRESTLTTADGRSGSLSIACNEL